MERSVAFDLQQMHTVTRAARRRLYTAERMGRGHRPGPRRRAAHAVDSRRVELIPAAGEDRAASLSTPSKASKSKSSHEPGGGQRAHRHGGHRGDRYACSRFPFFHGGLSVKVISQPLVSQPGPLSNGTTQVVQQTSVEAQDKPVNRIELKPGATVEDLVQELQRTGAGARDVISILQAMKEAGALEADLEVL